MQSQIHPTMQAVLNRFVPPAPRPAPLADPLLRYQEWKVSNLARALAMEAEWRAEHGPALIDAMLDCDAAALGRLRDDFLAYAAEFVESLAYGL